MESMSPPIHSLVYSTTSEAAEVDAAVVGAAVVCDSDAEDASSEVLSVVEVGSDCELLIVMVWVPSQVSGS